MGGENGECAAGPRPAPPARPPPRHVNNRGCEWGCEGREQGVDTVWTQGPASSIGLHLISGRAVRVRNGGVGCGQDVHWCVWGG